MATIELVQLDARHRRPGHRQQCLRLHGTGRGSPPVASCICCSATSSRGWPSSEGWQRGPSGALAELGSQTGAPIMLWIAAVGLVALGCGASPKRSSAPSQARSPVRQTTNRRGSARSRWALAIVNFAIAISPARFAMGSGQSSSQQNSGLSAQLMQSGWAKALLVAVGIGVIAVGGYHITRGPRRSLRRAARLRRDRDQGHRHHRIRCQRRRPGGRRTARDPRDAAGRSRESKRLDAAVKTLGQAPFGKFLLIAAALGIAAFGLYSFIRSRYSRM